ncbi:unnamed protein product [Rotaria socialis]
MATEIDGTSKGLLGTFAIFTLGSGLVSLIYGILLLSRNMSFNNNFGSINLFMTTVIGVWGMVSSKTGDLEKSIDTDIKLLKESTDATKSDIKKKAEFLNKYFNCCISCPSDANSEGEQQASSSSKPSGEGNTDNKPEMKDACATAYFQTKSKTIFCVAILTLASAGAVFLALLIYALIFQRARAGYTAVSRG